MSSRCSPTAKAAGDAALTEGEVEDLKDQLDGTLQPLFEDVTIDPEHT